MSSQFEKSNLVSRHLNINDFMRNYSYPTPLLTKLAVNTTLENKYPFIGLTFNMLQHHRELFGSDGFNGIDSRKNEVNNVNVNDNLPFNLLYIMNINTNYSKNVILEMFKSMIDSDNPNHETNSMIFLMSYHLMMSNCSMSILEPSMSGIVKEFNQFIQHPEVSYKNRTYNLNSLTPLCYNRLGDNMKSILVFFGLVSTFYIYGRPYKFYDEIGSESIPNQLYSNIENYFSDHYKQLSIDLNLKVVNNNFQEWFNVLSSMNRLDSYKNMLRTMLSSKNIINLRDTEMKKQIDLLNLSYQDQSVLSDDFLSSSFLTTIDELVEIMIDNNIVTKLMEKTLKFKPIDVSTFNSNLLKKVLECCLTGSTDYYILDSTSSHNFVQSNDSTVENQLQFVSSQSTTQSLSTQSLLSQSFKNPFDTDIIKFDKSFHQPFTSVDKVTQSCVEYIVSKLTEDNVFNQTDEIKIDVSDFTTSVQRQQLISDLMRLFTNPFIRKYESIVKYFVNPQHEFSSDQFQSLLDTKLMFDLNNLMNVSEIACDVYSSDVTSSLLIKPYLISQLPICIFNFIKSTPDLNHNFVQHSTQSCLDEFNLMKYLVERIVNPDLVVLDSLFNILRSSMFIHNSQFVSAVNEYIVDFNKILSQSLVFVPFISGNNDRCNLYSIGGIKLYNSYLNINPFLRGYNYISMLYGTSERLEWLKSKLSQFNDSTLIELISNSKNIETIIDVILNYSNKNPIDTLNDYYLKSNRFEHKSRNEFINSNQDLIKLLLDNSYSQTVGDYTSDEFRSIQLELSNDNKYVVKNLFNSSFGDLPVSITDEFTESYQIPVYKFVGQIESRYLKFVNPVGCKLYSFLIQDDNQSIFIFTRSDVDSIFDKMNMKYDVSDFK